MKIVKIDKVSKSLIHTFNNWMNKEECGSVLKSKYIDRTWRQEWYTSPAMALGTFFEWHVYEELGLNPEDSKEPPAELMATGKAKLKTGVMLADEDLKAEYRLAKIKAKRLSTLMIKSGIKPISVQAYITKDVNGITLHGYEDMEALFKRKKITIDLKYSGLLFDRWNKMGWLFNNEEQIGYHGVQAKHYEAITGKPFYYIVASPTNLIDVEMFRPVISPFAANQHIKKVESIVERMELMQEIDGFIDFPDYIKCQKCPLQAHKMCDNALRKLVPKDIPINS